MKSATMRPRSISYRVALLALISILCAPLSAVAQETPAALQLDVLVYNIEYEGDETTDAAIREIDADVVGVLESYDRLPEIAQLTGYPYYNSELQLLSKFPIHEPSDADGLYALIEVQPGFVVAFFNVHLDYVSNLRSQLNDANQGEAALAVVLEAENRVRTAALEPSLAAMQSLLEQGYAVFLTGDFNQPSSLDYPRTVNPSVSFPVPYPVSERLFALGFRDSFRDIHPDANAWLAPTIGNATAGTRIDFIYAAGPSTTLASDLVGPPSNPFVTVPFEPWTSDHRAVLSRFEVVPAAMPTLISVDARMGDVGDERAISYRAPTASGNRIAIVTEGGHASSPLTTLPAAEDAGLVVLDTGGWDKGGYEAVLLDTSDAELARVSFWLRDPQAQIQLVTSKVEYAPGESIEVRWNDGPGTRWDWIGIYSADDADPNSADAWGWLYGDGHSAGTLPPRTSGSFTFPDDAHIQDLTWPLPPGEYVVLYLPMDQYDVTGSATFTVTEAE